MARHRQDGRVTTPLDDFVTAKPDCEDSRGCDGAHRLAVHEATDWRCKTLSQETCLCCCYDDCSHGLAPITATPSTETKNQGLKSSSGCGRSRTQEG